MKKSYEPIQIILFLTALHSIIIGLFLIFSPNYFIEWFGFGNCNERFFRSQGGVFHIVISIAYLLALFNYTKNELLIWFILSVKLSASIFLLIYFIFVDSMVIILLSCITDFIIGILIYFAYLHYKVNLSNQVKDLK